MSLKATKILQYGDALYGRVTLPKESAATVIEVGDFVKVVLGKVQPIAATEADEFAGVAGMLSTADAGAPENVLVYTQAIVEVPAQSGQYRFGAPLQKHVTNDTVEASAGADSTLGYVWQSDTGAAATSVLMLIDIRAVSGLLKPTTV